MSYWIFIKKFQNLLKNYRQLLLPTANITDQTRDELTRDCESLCKIGDKNAFLKFRKENIWNFLKTFREEPTFLPITAEAAPLKCPYSEPKSWLLPRMDNKIHVSNGGFSKYLKCFNNLIVLIPYTFINDLNLIGWLSWIVLYWNKFQMNKIFTRKS